MIQLNFARPFKQTLFSVLNLFKSQPLLSRLFQFRFELFITERYQRQSEEFFFDPHVTNLSVNVLSYFGLSSHVDIWTKIISRVTGSKNCWDDIESSEYFICSPNLGTQLKLKKSHMHPLTSIIKTLYWNIEMTIFGIKIYVQCESHNYLKWV